MKKMMATLLACTMVLSLAACGSKKEKAEDVDNTEVQETSEGKVFLSDYQGDEEGVVGDLEGEVLLDKKDIKITAHKISYTKNDSADIALTITNGSSQDLYFQTRNETVNGCIVNGIFSEMIEAGKERELSLWFDNKDLNKYGIIAIDTIQFNFYIFTTDTFEEYLTTEMLTIDLNESGETVRESVAENILYEGNNIRVVELLDAMNEETAFEYVSSVKVENKTDKEIIVMSSFFEHPEENKEDVKLFAQVPAGMTSVVSATLNEGEEEPEIAEILETSGETENDNNAVDEIPVEEEQDPYKEVSFSFTISGCDEPITVKDAKLTMRCDH